MSGTPVEGQPVVRRGHVARIQNGADFFVALEDHVEWGHAFTVWGEMHDAAGLATLEAITRLPYHEQSGAGGTIMRLLDAELPATGVINEQLRSDELTESRDLGTAADSAATAMATEL